MARSKPPRAGQVRKPPVAAADKNAFDALDSRFDGIDGLARSARPAFEAWIAESTLPASGSIRHGAPVQICGRFEKGRGDPIAAASKVLLRLGEVIGAADPTLGLDLDRARPCDGAALPSSLSTLIFPFAKTRHAVYRGGASVTVGADGVVHGLQLALPRAARVRESQLLGEKAAREQATKRYPDLPLVDGGLMLLDPELVFGDSAEPALAWVFRSDSETPADVIVPAGGDDANLRVVMAPGCGIGPLPSFHRNPATGAPDFVMFPAPGLLLPEASSRNPAAVAQALFRRYPKLFGTGVPAHQLALAEVLSEGDPRQPWTTVILRQRWGALPVYGCELRVHLAPSLAVRGVSGNFLREPGTELTPNIGEDEARAAAEATWMADHPRATPGKAGSEPWQLGRLIGLDEGIAAEPERPVLRKVVLSAQGWQRLWKDRRDAGVGAFPATEARGLVILPSVLARSGGGRNHLAWWFRQPDAERFVSAATGHIVMTIPRLHSAERVFDGTGAIGPTPSVDLQVLDGVPQVAANALDADALPAAAGLGGVTAFWRTLRRNSWDGLGGDLDAYVDSAFTNGPNAQWDGTRTLYSPQWAAPDVVGHECTHALIQATCNLVYLDESGAANEHLADLFGNLIFPDANPQSWLVGEQIPSGALRDMRNPLVRTYQNYAVLQPNNDAGGVHTNSGILNRAAVLLCDGELPAIAVGIGRSRLTRLAWDVMLSRLHPWAGFTDLLHVMWARARELGESGALGAAGVPGTAGPPPAFAADTANLVAQAFAAVGLRLDLQHGWFDVTIGTPFETAAGVNGFVADVVLHEGELLPAGQTLTEMEIRFFQRNGFASGSLRAGVGGVLNAIDGTFSAQFFPPKQLGTDSLETRVRLTSPTALPIFMVPVPTIANAPTTPTLPVASVETDRVAHWIDVLPIGGRYRDLIYDGALLPPGCFVVNVELIVVFRDNAEVGRTDQVGQNVNAAHFGARLADRTLGGRSLRVEVHSWHDAYTAARFRIRYTIAGNGWSLPPLTLRSL